MRAKEKKENMEKGAPLAPDAAARARVYFCWCCLLERRETNERGFLFDFPGLVMFFYESYTNIKQTSLLAMSI